MSPAEAKRLVGHSSPQPEAGIAECFHCGEHRREDPEIERLRTALRAVRASTDPRWINQIIKDALREESR